MKIYLLVALLLSGTSCEAKQPQWGEESFVIENLQQWSDEAVVRSCSTDDDQSIFLFQSSNKYVLITRYKGVFDLASIDASADPIEIEANGGLGRYVEIQEQFEALRRLPGDKLEQTEYAAFVTSAPMARCEF